MEGELDPSGSYDGKKGEKNRLKSLRKAKYFLHKKDESGEYPPQYTRQSEALGMYEDSEIRTHYVWTKKVVRHSQPTLPVFPQSPGCR